MSGCRAFWPLGLFVMKEQGMSMTFTQIVVLVCFTGYYDLYISILH